MSFARLDVVTCCDLSAKPAAKFPLNIHWTGSPLGMSVSETQVSLLDQTMKWAARYISNIFDNIQNEHKFQDFFADIRNLLCWSWTWRHQGSSAQLLLVTILWRSYRWNCVGICVVEPGFAIFFGNFWQDMFPALQVRALQLPNFSFYMPTSWKLDDAAEHVYHLLDLELLSCCSNSKYRDWFRLRDWESTFWRRFGFARCLPICALLWSRLDACVLDLESCKNIRSFGWNIRHDDDSWMCPRSMDEMLVQMDCIILFCDFK